jgi:ribosomal protein S18 acetylase RimI-like enzyme
MVDTAFVVRPVNWTARRDELRAIRRTVFIEEQHVPEELEWDDIDERAYHVLATNDDGAAIGTGRLSLDCQIGRMAVAREWRGRGVGSALVSAAIERARAEGLHKVSLDVFPHNAAGIALYRKFGFVEEGRRVGHYRRANGELWDAIVMGLLL